jgi:hypothetical protein
MYNGSRWIQYRALLKSGNTGLTPALKSVTVQYNLLHEASIAWPAHGAILSGPQNITWSASDGDNDSLAFDICLENESAKIPLAKDLSSDTRSWSWNTDTIPNGTYWIRITARDDNPSIPLSADAISGKFTIQHPAPPPANHLPHVTLISPPDNSFRPTDSAHLLWIGTDPDNDTLTYTVRYSDRPFVQGPVINRTTTAEFLDLFNLSDNTTYYWSVSAFDGKPDGTSIPTEVWSFTVRLPPANIPVRFSSTPPASAWVGKEYAYNLTSIDEDGDIPTYSIVSAPSAIALDPSTGKLRWTPTKSDLGNHTLTLQVSDGRGSTDRQTFTITVLDIPPPIAPKCAITYPANGTKVNGTIQVRGTATNGTLPLSIVRVRIDNGAWTLAVGLGSWTYTLNTARLAKGNHRIEAKAFDANLSSDTASVDFTVSNPEPGVSSGGNTWCLPAAAIAIIAGIAVLTLSKRRMH